MSNGTERFMNEEGKIVVWPKKHADKELVLAYLIIKFDFGVIYNELDVNDILKRWHAFSDWPLLRRELFERGYFDRNLDGTIYRRLK
jgi:chloramphenicol O-acetyltransferase type A